MSIAQCVTASGPVCFMPNAFGAGTETPPSCAHNAAKSGHMGNKASRCNSGLGSLRIEEHRTRHDAEDGPRRRQVRTPRPWSCGLLLFTGVARMLCLSRKELEAIDIGTEVRITVTRIKGNRVTIGIDAPEHLKVVRVKPDDKPKEEAKAA
jgi:carbon storage regulator